MNSERIDFWKEFICNECEFPCQQNLRRVFENAEFYEFCECGCNSFSVRFKNIECIEPIATKGSNGAVFEANFYLEEEGKTLEIILLADEDGYLNYVEIDCCANAYPVPEIIKVRGRPFHIYTSDSLLR